MTINRCQENSRRGHIGKKRHKVRSSVLSQENWSKHKTEKRALDLDWTAKMQFSLSLSLSLSLCFTLCAEYRTPIKRERERQGKRESMLALRECAHTRACSRARARKSRIYPSECACVCARALRPATATRVFFKNSSSLIMQLTLALALSFFPTKTCDEKKGFFAKLGKKSTGENFWLPRNFFFRTKWNFFVCSPVFFSALLLLLLCFAAFSFSFSTSKVEKSNWNLRFAGFFCRLPFA